MIHQPLDRPELRRRLCRIDLPHVLITLEASVSGASLVRTTSCAPSGPNCGAAPDRYICQPGLPSTLLSRTSATTPMTRASMPLTFAMRPIGSCPGQSLRATVSLMMTTPFFLSLSSH